MNYGFEVYGDQLLAESWRAQSLALYELLMNMKFLTLDGNPLIDSTIKKCWHNGYDTILELAVDTKKLLGELGETDMNEGNAGGDKENMSSKSEVKAPEETSGERYSDQTDTDILTDDNSKTQFCRDLEKHGLLDLLFLADPNDLGRVQLSVPAV
ncbi:uncharacterized protein N7483_001979 [Penicillium malachiteum]|uniref:uncharacterized protein n=1 Tax=Penicillium malachiteum TaxID=1324776 RepID=UPI002549318D|nr:uncharacterized protein N7483_001979 [Penicillium malachiteum]KAJ5736854.1 hypothetical protein N7483_001979 [Penicillium malachiteum]